MSVGLDTSPLLTKNFAGGSSDTLLLAGPVRLRNEPMVAQAGGRAKPGIASPARVFRHVAHADPAGRPRIIAGMLLALDIGNTNISAALVAGGEVAPARRAATRSAATVDELELLLEGQLELDGQGLAAISEIVLASVVPSLTAAVTAVAERRGLRLLVADAPTVPIPLRVERPLEVGADRLVNSLAAGRLYGAPAIVVDFGTA